jgi:hypothetical protein
MVRVEPIAFRVDFEIGDLREFRRLDEKLLLGPERRDKFDFVVVEIELAAVQILVRNAVSGIARCRRRPDPWTSGRHSCEH